MSTNPSQNYQSGPCADETSTIINTSVIPTDINSYGLREAASFYTEELGYAVHPLTPSGSVDSASRGKKPITSLTSSFCPVRSMRVRSFE